MAFGGSPVLPQAVWEAEGYSAVWMSRVIQVASNWGGATSVPGLCTKALGGKGAAHVVCKLPPSFPCV